MSREVIVCYGSEHQDVLERVAFMYKLLYDGERELGLSLPLIEGGEWLWYAAMKKSLGKYSEIVIAVDSNQAIGYSAGIIKITAPWYGSRIVGYWDSMYIMEDYRGMGLGDKMTKLLIGWWRSRKAEVIEGERLVVNKSAKGHYERLGFKEELLKYRIRCADQSENEDE